jgi:hypothetical protein
MPPFRDRIHRALIYAPINSGEMAGSGGATSEFGHEDIANDCTHCGVCPWCRRRVGGYEQGVQDRSASLVRAEPNSQHREAARGNYSPLAAELRLQPRDGKRGLARCRIISIALSQALAVPGAGNPHK